MAYRVLRHAEAFSRSAMALHSSTNYSNFRFYEQFCRRTRTRDAVNRESERPTRPLDFLCLDPVPPNGEMKLPE